MMATDTDQVRPARPPRVPPPPPPLREVEFLKQVDDSLGLALWKALRNVHTWVAVQPGERKRYFRPLTNEARELWAYARHAAPELDSAISTFALMVQAPGAIDPEQIGAACDAVHTWADARGMMLTALFFAEAAAYVLADLPSRANQAARAARRSLERERAAMWYMRAYRLAVRHEDRRERRKELIWALLGYGSMMRDAGNYDEARRFIERAARRAVGLRRLKEAGMAYHELFVIAAEKEQYTLAGKYARDALERYPIRHVSLPHFAHDVSFHAVHPTAAIQRGSYDSDKGSPAHAVVAGPRTRVVLARVDRRRRGPSGTVQGNGNRDADADGGAPLVRPRHFHPPGARRPPAGGMGPRIEICRGRERECEPERGPGAGIRIG